jgi:hypothetical protein
MKTTLKFNFPSLEIRKNDATLEVGEGTSLEFTQEYSAEEMLEIVKTKPQIISAIKTAVKEIVETIGEYENNTADVHCRYNNERPYPKPPKAPTPTFHHHSKKHRREERT